jgi:hypothetical protein
LSLSCAQECAIEGVVDSIFNNLEPETARGLLVLVDAELWDFMEKRMSSEGDDDMRI